MSRQCGRKHRSYIAVWNPNPNHKISPAILFPQRRTLYILLSLLGQCRSLFLFSSLSNHSHIRPILDPCFLSFFFCNNLMLDASRVGMLRQSPTTSPFLSVEIPFLQRSFRNQKRATRVLNFSRFQICKYFHEAGVLGMEATLDNQRVAFRAILNQGDISSLNMTLINEINLLVKKQLNAQCGCACTEDI